MDYNHPYTPEVKKNIINLLMFNLYSDERTIYREYVQNAYDSIRRAVDIHLLAKPKDGVVQINIDEQGKCISIHDNGTGISVEKAVQVLLDISSSTKDGINQAGQYGIGRLVGGGYCRKLVFTTSAKDEDVATRIEFDVEKIWQMVKEDATDYAATEVIDRCTKREQIPFAKEEHFFEVSLIGVRQDKAPALLHTEGVIDYLREVAPVDYKTPFSSTLIYNSILLQPEYKELHEGLGTVQIFVGATRIEKQYGLKVAGTGDEISNLEYFKLEDGQYGMLGWGWYALTKFTKQIPASDSLAGIRLRKHNIQIGDAQQLSTLKYWKESRGNSYFYGEVFAIHPHIMPNGARDGLAPSPETKAFDLLLKEQFALLHTLYHKANMAKKSIDKINEGAKRIKQTADDHKAKDLIDNNGVAVFEKQKSNAVTPTNKRLVQLFVPDYDKAVKEVAKARKGNSPNAVVHAGKSPSALHESSPTEETAVTEPSPTLPSVKMGKEDIIAPLQGLLSEDEVWMLRRVFQVLTLFCPNNEHDKDLMEEMKKLIVKEFKQ